jgi:hypothetical protein
MEPEADGTTMLVDVSLCYSMLIDGS